MSSDSKVRWGIVSTADIGIKKVIPGIMKSAHSEVVAIGSRDLGRAQAAAAKLGIPRAYGSYEELLADPDIDAIYNPLPNHLHVPITIAATKAGKHVLCEKPIGLNAKDAERLRECPADRLVLELHGALPPAMAAGAEIGARASWAKSAPCERYFPISIPTRPMCATSPISAAAAFSISAVIRWWGARFLFEAEPKRVVSLIERDPGFKTDILASVIADFGGGGS